jgi:Transposase zinc-ribbon domain
MAMNKIQFQQGMSMAQFERCYGDEAACAAALFAARWPVGFACPRCHGRQFAASEGSDMIEGTKFGHNAALDNLARALRH